MKPGKDYLGVGAAALIINDAGYVFMMKRGAAARNEVGSWSIPGGKVEKGELLADTVIREVKEECDITITSLSYVGYAEAILEHEDEHWVSHIFVATEWSGDPKNCEPDKCDEIAWFHKDNLPEQMSKYAEIAIGLMQKD